MCGIAGGVGIAGVCRPDERRVARMSGMIAHRGPDAEGAWHSPTRRAAFAHRRLSIIDLSSGQQPMCSADGSLALIFNGEIYNYRELRAELAADGYRFRSESDTEVILALYERCGAACLERLRGMFAFALWDERHGTLLLARDRIGKKPVYYTIEDGCLWFASSLGALRDTAGFRWSVDPEAVDAFLSLSYVPAPKTIFRDVWKLEAGCALTIDRTGIRVQRYWDPSPLGTPFQGSYHDAVDRLDELLDTAVSLRLRSDVPLGIFLSGGIDSSLVTAIAAKQLRGAVSTYAIGFDDAGFDERGYARRVAEALGTEHHEFQAHADLLGVLPEMVRHYGEPYADPSVLPLWLLAERTRRHVTVALGGDGGDECFAGYDWYHAQARYRRITRAVPESVFALTGDTLGEAMGAAFPNSRRVGQVRRGMRTLATRAGGPRFAAARSFVGAEDARLLYAGELHEMRASGRDPSADRLAPLYERCAGSDLRRMRYVDMATYLADGLMPKVDVATMAHGLEARAPLLDQEVIGFALSLPDEWLVDARGGKRILRDVLHRYLPPALFQRPKHGFNVPLTRWMDDGPSGALATLAGSERLMGTGWFSPDRIRAMHAEHTAGARDHSQRLFSLLVLDEWLAQS